MNSQVLDLQGLGKQVPLILRNRRLLVRAQWGVLSTVSRHFAASGDGSRQFLPIRYRKRQVSLNLHLPLSLQALHPLVASAVQPVPLRGE